MKKLAEWASKHKVALSASILAAVVVIGLMVLFWGWLSDGESGSTTIRNVGLVIGGAIALAIAGWRSVVADRQSRAAQRQAATARADLLNKRYQDGAAMLGNAVLPVRFAGIYALERLADDHPGEYHIEVMKLLCAFVRNPTEDGGLESDKMRVDVQAAMDAICACHARHKGLETDADFELDLRQAELRGLVLTAQDLSNSTDLSEAHLDSAYLRGVKLMGAQLIAAELRGVDFLAANLSRADFMHANLDGALLQEANISGALFASPFDLDEIPAFGSAKGLTQAQLDRARADPTKPPRLDGVLDAKTGKQLVWRGRTLDGKPHPNPPPIPDA